MSTPRQPDSPDPLESFEVARRLFASIEVPDEDDEESSSFPTIPGYVIEAELGAGGNGTVYRAVRAGKDLPLAIKVCHFGLRSRRQSERAHRELSLLRRLRVPALPRLYDYGEVDGCLYLVTELIEGEDLESWHQSQHLDLRGTVSLLVRVARALQSIHEHGIIHRDVKPSNVMIDGDGDPVLIDLGIATLVSEHASQETLTVEGQPLGSPAFMAPEQARGDRSAVSVRSDVYSLGATAFRILTGTTPHEHTTSVHENVRRVAQDPPRRLRVVSPDLPRALESILAKALAVRPEDRYASADGFANDLERWLRREPTVAHSDALVERMARLVRHWPLRATAILSVALIVVTVVVYAVFMFSVRSRPAMLIMDNEGRSAQVEDLNGKTVRRWIDGGKVIFRGGEFVDDVAALGGRDVVVLAFESQMSMDGAEHLAGKLCVYDAGALNGEPLWVADTPANNDEFEMPDPVSETLVRPFSIRDFAVFDVFDDSTHPGKELISVHQIGLMSQSCIRIYSFNGTILYEAWYDGDLRDPTWLPGSGMLFLVGCNSEGSLRDRGHPEVQCVVHPQVVLGLRPRPNVFLTDKWLGSEDSDTKVRAALHRAIGPVASYDDFFDRGEEDRSKRAWGLHIANEELMRTSDDRVRIILEQREATASVSFVLHPDGTSEEPVVTSTFVQEGYRDDAWRLIELVDVPENSREYNASSGDE